MSDSLSDDEIQYLPRDIIDSSEPDQWISTKPRIAVQVLDDDSEEDDHAPLDDRIVKLDQEINSIDSQIQNLQSLRKQLVKQRKEIASSIPKPAPSTSQLLTSVVPSSRAGSTNSQSTTDYSQSNWQWSKSLRDTAKQIWNIDNFRYCQEAVCNAVMSNRDVVCIMPTGGGKSVCYQLPAIVSPGCTLVISPLVSLITDQILHLREAGIEAVMLTGATSREESTSIMRRLSGGKPSKGKGKAKAEEEDQPDIKLLYVTPEKLSKAKLFINCLTKMYEAGTLTRVAIDEAHCCSSQGHDFRPDYKKLNMLKTLFPTVPVIAFTATCPANVLQEVLTILKLRPTTPGEAANTNGTVFFSSPLYRPNLRYSVIPKASSADAVVEDMVKWILEHRKGESGIVYCLSQKDAETVAQKITATSKGKIRAATYHSNIADSDKLQIHEAWRSKKIHVVCSTTAFGLGIDKPDVRFVLHHSMSKSLEGYYQESGRAGRDGLEADCVMFYRGNDVGRLTSMTCFETGGQEKLYAMLSYALDVKECRKIAFSKYFELSAGSINTFSVDKKDEVCGHCDNCIRDDDSIKTVDVAMDAWKIIKTLRSIFKGEKSSSSGRVTVTQLTDLVRGLGSGNYNTADKGVNGKLDLARVAGSKVSLNKEDTETLIWKLLVDGYLAEWFHSTSYSVIAYLKPDNLATRLDRLTAAQIEAGEGPTIELDTVVKARVKRTSKKRKQDENVEKSPINLDHAEDFDAEQAFLEVQGIEDDEEESDIEWEAIQGPSQRARIA